MRAADRRVPSSLHVLAGCLILLLVATGSAGALRIAAPFPPTVYT